MCKWSSLTHLTEKENSPGADSLCRTRKTPVTCQRRCCSASSLDTAPANHLWQHTSYIRISSYSLWRTNVFQISKKKKTTTTYNIYGQRISLRMRKERNVVHRHKASPSLNLCYDPVWILFHFCHLQHIHTITPREHNNWSTSVINTLTLTMSPFWKLSSSASDAEKEKSATASMLDQEKEASTEMSAHEWKETKRWRRPAGMPEWPQSGCSCSS